MEHHHAILTGSGGILRYDNLDNIQVKIDDVAYGLAFSCRFSGQCVDQESGRRVFYSVAEHCVRMSEIVPPELAYDALMHEAGEAFCGDIPGPLKLFCPEIRKIEKDIERAVHKLFQVDIKNRTAIKYFDHVMLATEIRDLMPSSSYKWMGCSDIVPLPDKINPWSPEFAASAFLERFSKLNVTYLY